MEEVDFSPMLEQIVGEVKKPANIVSPIANLSPTGQQSKFSNILSDIINFGDKAKNIIDGTKLPTVNMTQEIKPNAVSIGLILVLAALTFGIFYKKGIKVKH